MKVGSSRARRAGPTPGSSTADYGRRPKNRPREDGSDGPSRPASVRRRAAGGGRGPFPPGTGRSSPGAGGGAPPPPNAPPAAPHPRMPPHKAEESARTHEADFAYTLEGVGRFRVNVLRQRDSVGLAIRWVSPEDLTFSELNLPAVIQTLAESRRGLVLVTGPTGAGKTTTIASMIGFINRTRRGHVGHVGEPDGGVHPRH